MRLVLDTNVVASALLWGGVPRLLLRAGREKRVELFTSTPLLAELTDILWRRKFDKKIAASTLSVDQLVDRSAEVASLVRPSVVPRIGSIICFYRFNAIDSPPRLQQHMERISQLPKLQQRFAIQVLESVLGTPPAAKRRPLR